MNKQRRKAIDRAMALIDDARTIISEVTSDEQEARDNLPENMQDSERAGAMDEAIGLLEEVETAIDDVWTNLEDAKGD